MISRIHIEQSITEYSYVFPEDHGLISELIEFVRVVPDPTTRKEFRGHMTCTACVLNQHDEVLMIQHHFLGMRLFPGGHIEATDSTLRGTAMRELEEETGIGPDEISSAIIKLQSCPVYINRHTIPANPAYQEPEHEHWDFCFLFAASQALSPRVTSEITAAEWVPTAELLNSFRRHLKRFRESEAF